MTHEQKEVNEFIDGFKEFGMTENQARFATFKVIEAKYREAFVNAPMGSRVSYWEKAIDYLRELVTNQPTQEQQ